MLKEDVLQMEPSELIARLVSLGWTLESIELATGVHKSNLSRIHNRKREAPSYKVVDRLRSTVIELNMFEGVL